MKIRTALAVCTITALALVGCGGDPVPKVAVRPPPSVSPAAPPAPSVTPVPAPVDETPQEFIRRWFAAAVDMQNSGATEAFLALAHECGSCRRLASRVDKYYAAGGYFKGGEIELSYIAPVEPGSLTFFVRTTSLPTRFKTTSTSTEQSFPGGDLDYNIILNTSGNAWRITEFLIEGDPK